MNFSYKNNLLIASRIATLGLYKGNESDWLKTRKAASIIVAMSFKAMEAYAISCGTVLVLQKLANDVEYTKDFYDKFSGIKNFINSTNIFYYSIATVTVLMALCCYSAYSKNNSCYNNETLYESPKDEKQNKVQFLQLAAAQTSPSIISLTLLFTFAQYCYNMVASSYMTNGNKNVRGDSSSETQTKEDSILNTKPSIESSTPTINSAADISNQKPLKN